jgi:hypothetical protein
MPIKTCFQNITRYNNITYYRRVEIFIVSIMDTTCERFQGIDSINLIHATSAHIHYMFLFRVLLNEFF